MSNTHARAITSLIAIMNNKKASLRNRIDACEALLSYEAPDETVGRAKTFLTNVFENMNVAIDDRLSALKLMRKASAPRVTQSTVRTADADKDREFWRTVEVSARRMKLFRAGLWGAHAKDWADDIIDDPNYVPPHDKSISELFED